MSKKLEGIIEMAKTAPQEKAVIVIAPSNDGDNYHLYMNGGDLHEHIVAIGALMMRCQPFREAVRMACKVYTEAEKKEKISLNKLS